MEKITKTNEEAIEMAMAERDRNIAKNKALREHYGIVVDTTKPMYFKEIMQYKSQKEGFFGDYKRNRTVMLRDREPSPPIPFYVLYQR